MESKPKKTFAAEARTARKAERKAMHTADMQSRAEERATRATDARTALASARRGRDRRDRSKA